MPNKKIKHFRKMGGSIELRTNFDSILRLGDYAIKSYTKTIEREVIKGEGSLSNMYIKELKRIVKSGGRGLGKYGMAWDYWQRTKGQKDFRLIRGGSKEFRAFNTGWRYGSRRKQSFPILPSSYFKRKSRKKPRGRQYALYDTGNVYNGFSFQTNVMSDSLTVFFLNKNKGLLEKHEKGIKSKKGLVRRKVIEPAWLKVSSSGKFKRILGKSTLVNIDKEIRKHMR